MATITKVTLGQFADCVSDLISATKVDALKLRNAVNAALGEMAHQDSKEDGKMSYKAGTKTKPEGFKLSEKQLNTFATSGNNPGLRFFYFNQEMLRLEQQVGTMSLAAWPSYIEAWMGKMLLVTA